MIVTAVLMLLGAREISMIFSRLEMQVPQIMIIPGCLFLAAAAYQYKGGYPADALIIILIFYLVLMTAFYPRFTPIDVAISFFGTIYVGLLIFLFLISTLPNGLIWLVLVLVCTWSSDTLAYLVGRRWGKRRMAPELSPGKTLEGAVGGVLGSTIAAWVVVMSYSPLPLWPVLSLGFITGLAAQIGDLVESAIKRLAGIKDAGNLIPGHGGVLDRFDSMLFTAPLVYYYVVLILHN
ncbi:CDP-diglyceride synthetase [Desulfoscipio gibsoniae DSM 7213]|uniref:Phosphatidate cytidylyltransferase n=1 Tax=Desulfoscipio gibsoniae DSM 7213 TaxID=767817 RepID=R4KNS3_9FIRM|nr:CDP-diglyceride synthetase [Desulfoscipio gibsoniae DSM 7213]